MSSTIDTVNYSVSPCEQCTKSHDYSLDVCYEKTDILVERIAPVNEPAPFSLQLQCPNTGKFFTQPVTGSEVVSPFLQEKDITAISVHASTQVADSLTKALGDEFDTWVKSSIDTSIDFCKTMISTATGAIAVFFSVLSFLGLSSAKTTNAGYVLVAWLGTFTSILFLISAVFFFLGLRPLPYALNDTHSFFDARKQRIEEINRYIIRGSVSFGLAIFIAIITFLLALLLLK